MWEILDIVYMYGFFFQAKGVIYLLSLPSGYNYDIIAMTV
jgi:hypothetical protein